MLGKFWGGCRVDRKVFGLMGEKNLIKVWEEICFIEVLRVVVIGEVFSDEKRFSRVEWSYVCKIIVISNRNK